MKILRLDLLAFGPFTDVSLDLSDGREGLHLIYGPNEAGKSSSLRALRRLLYGFEHLSTDAFLHPAANLRVGALLRAGDGRELACVRRRGRKNTLRAADDSTPADEQLLAQMLGGLEEKAFRERFGIDHEQLVRGGEQIVQGAGEIGEILFAAGSGIANLGAVERRLQQEADELFKSRASNPPINRALAELKAAAKVTRDSSLADSEWMKHDHDLKAARGRKDEVEARRTSLAANRRRLERFRDALPDLTRRAQLLDELRGLADAPRLPDDFSERRRAAVAGLEVAGQAARAAERQLATLDEALAQIELPEALLARADEIAQLATDLGRYLSGQRDLPKLVAQREQLQAQTADALRRDFAELLDENGAPRVAPSKADRLRIQTLGARHEAIISKQQDARQRVEKLRRDLRAYESHPAQAAPPRDPAELRRAIRRVQKEGPLEAQRDEARGALELLEKQAEVDLRKLPLWEGTLANLEQLRLPSGESLDRFEQELAAADAAVEGARRSADAPRGQLEQIAAELERLRLERQVPTEEELDAARILREHGWRLILAAWRGEADPQAEAAFIEKIGGPSDLAAAYEHAVRGTDELADRLRREAESVARKAALLADRQTQQQRLAAAEAALLAAHRERAAVQEQWNAAWGEAGVAPLSPREMRRWLARQAKLVAAAEAIRARRGELEQIDRRVEQCRSDLGESLAAVGAEPPPHEPLAATVERCEELVEKIDADRAARAQWEQERARIAQELPDAEQAAEQADAAVDAWREEWTEAARRAGLADGAAPAVANELLSVYGEIQAREREAETLTERVEAIERDAAEFRARVAALAEQLELKDTRRAPEQIVGELREALAGAQRDQTVRGETEQQQAREREKLREAQQAVVARQAALKVLCDEAACGRAEELPDAERRAEARRKCESELRLLEGRLGQLAGGAALEEFAAEAAKIDADQLEPEINRLGEQLAELDEEKSRLDQTIGEERQALAAMNGGARAAEAKEDEQALLAQLAADGERYVRLRLAALALHDAIERYREKNQGPVLQRASELFARLTLGRYARLEAEYDDAAQAVLVGVRETDGKAEKVRVAGMSDGTADQLYLALRLASIEHYLERNEPVPLVVDDILNRFDDARALAALESLAELSNKTQVIFFTHHAHLVELARARLPKDSLFTHDLSRAARAETNGAALFEK